MLIQFKVANFRSFKDEQILSMVAASISSQDKRLDEENVFRENDDLCLLKSAILYGANASGKSNLIKALDFMRRQVLDSSKETQSAESIPVEPFQLNKETAKAPSCFELIFIVGNRHYRYGFEVDQVRVVKEWLFYTPTIREARLFERNGRSYQIGSSFKEGKGLETKTRENALFLSVTAQFNGEVSQAILHWFRQLNLISGLHDTTLLATTERMLEANVHKAAIVNLIKQLDLNIHDLEIISTPLNLSELKGHSEDMLELYRKMLEARGWSSSAKELKTRHRIYDNEGGISGYENFNMEQHESEGTKKIIALAGPIIQSLREGKSLIVDEFDARLHPLVTQELIRLFNSKESNPQNAQLIVTTHDTNLLSKELFRRDQIWFAEKDRLGATHLYSLVEYKVRNDASFESNYIQGRYGAIPFIGNVTQAVGETDA